MRPLLLTMQAFGPYATKDTIDFRLLGNRTMFVISGNTGAGKTTIFDGICFAIFGRPSGDDRSGSDLRSHFASDEHSTEVSLQFILKNETYLIWRSPQQEKKKARGEGMTTVNAKAELYHVKEDGSRELLAANVRDTDEKIKDLIQLDVHQFRQILMIPQGEFRKLLISDSKDKEGILQKLFHTELYKWIEVQMKDQANALRNRVEQSKDEKISLLNTIAYEESEAVSDEEPLNEEKALQRLRELITTLESKLETLKNRLIGEKEDRDEAKKRADEAEDLLKQFISRDQLRKLQNELLQKEPEMLDIKNKLANAEKAKGIIHQEQICQRLHKTMTEQQSDHRQEADKLKAAELELEEALAKFEMEKQKQPERESVLEALTRLQQLKDDVYLFAERKSTLNRLVEQLENMEFDKVRASKQLKKIQQELEQKRQESKRLEQLRVHIHDQEKHLIELEGLKKTLAHYQSVYAQSQTMENERMEQERLLKGLQREWDDASGHLSALEEAWRNGQAGLLASALENNSPCPVCGSLHHPAPQQPTSGFPSEKEMEEAGRSVQTLAKSLQDQQGIVFRLTARLESISSTLHDCDLEVKERLPDFSAGQLDDRLEWVADQINSATTSLKEGRQQLSQLEKLGLSISMLEKKEIELTELMQNSLLQENELKIHHTQVAVTIENSLKQIPEAVRTIEAYEQLVSTYEKKKRVMETQLESARNHYTATKEQVAILKGTVIQLEGQIEKSASNLKEERALFLHQMEQAGFSTYKEYESSKRSQAEMDAYAESFQNYREEMRSVNDRLTEYNAWLQNAARPDVAELKKKFQEKDRLCNELSETQANLSLQIHRHKEICARVEKIDADIKDAEKKYEMIGHLADIASGKNRYRLTFERYVLASFLDDILDSANARLLKMTSGRYELVRKKDRSKGNVQSGLELLVFDQYTGYERHVKTLSGGESFKASLALALGLADVVQEHAGGVSLETMFIDEGFGTLDPESLEQAIEALMDIQSSGRLVGIISHVPELKERMDARLEVHASQEGSRTEFRFLG